MFAFGLYLAARVGSFLAAVRRRRRPASRRTLPAATHA
jgi:hypothetical protein